MTKWYKVKVDSAVMSEAIQLFAFEHGYRWDSIKSEIQPKIEYADRPALCIATHLPNRLFHSNSSGINNPEIDRELSITDFLTQIASPIEIPIMIDNNEVLINDDGLYLHIGCTTVHYKTVKEIYNRMQGKKIDGLYK